MEATETMTRPEPAELHGIPGADVVHFDGLEMGALRLWRRIGPCGEPLPGDPRSWDCEVGPWAP